MSGMQRFKGIPLVFAMAVVAGAQTRPHNFDLTDVRWSVSFNEPKGKLMGDVTNTLIPSRNAREITLDAGEMRIKSVYVDGKPTRFRHLNQRRLAVTLPRAGDGKRAAKVRVVYECNPEAGAYFVPASRAYPATTSVIYTQGEMEDNRFWLPTYDYPDDKATSEAFIEVPAGYTAISNGRLVGVKPKGKNQVFHWKMDQPHVTYLISFVVGQYEQGKETWDGIPVTWGVPKGLKAQGESTFGGTADIVRFFSKLTGFRYPYAKYSQNAVPDYMFGGMENITATTQTIGALHPRNTKPLEDATGLVAHELAHQWFGDTVTTNGWSDIWINEGWASFLPSFYLRERDGQEAFDISRYEIFQGGLSGDRNRPVVWKGYKDPLDMFDGHAYPGGASRMFMLMRQLGEDTFWKATKAYLEERKYTSFDTQAFFKTWSKNAGRDLTPFMQQWFFTAGAPELTASVSGNELVVTQGAVNFNLDLPVWILGTDNQWVKRSLAVRGKESRMDLGDLAGRPVLLDPEVWTMGVFRHSIPLTFEQRLALWDALPNAAAQLRFLEFFTGEMNAAEKETFARRIRSPRMLERFVGRLDATSAKFLMEQSNSPDRRLANAAMDRLSQVDKSPATLALFRTVYAGDPNERLRQWAGQRLLQATNDEKLAQQFWGRSGFRDAYRQIALDWWVRNRPELARERALEAIQKGYPEPTRVEAIRHLGRLKDKPGERRVYDVLVKVLNEKSFGARNTAMNALADYGDKRAIPLLEPMTKHSLVFFRQTAAGAIARLRG